MKSSNFSEEQINLFVDNQLGADEACELYNEMERDEELKARILELQTLKSMVRQAYSSPPATSHSKESYPFLTKCGWFPKSAVAGIVLMIGVAIGWVASSYITDLSAVRVVAETESEGVVLHLNSPSPQKLEAALDMAESLLVTYKKGNSVTQVELVVNAGGLDLLRVDKSPFAKRIGSLQSKFDNLTFIACANAIKRFSNESGAAVPLLPSAQIASSAVEQIVMRVQQGWRYQKI